MSAVATQCTIAGCGKLVQKAGHTLCYAHWKGSQNRAAEPTTAYDMAQEVQAADEPVGETSKTGFLNSTQLGEKLGLSGKQVNSILSELGWIERDGKGWSPSEQGVKLCAERALYGAGSRAVPLVRWPERLWHRVSLSRR